MLVVTCYMINREIMSWVRGEAGLRRHIQGSSRARVHHGGGALRSEDRQSLASLVVGLHLSVSPHLQTQKILRYSTYKTDFNFFN